MGGVKRGGYCKEAAADSPKTLSFGQKRQCHKTNTTKYVYYAIWLFPFFVVRSFLAAGNKASKWQGKRKHKQQWRWQNKSNNCACLSLQIHTGAHGVYAISVHFLPFGALFFGAVLSVLFCFILFVLPIAATCLLKTLMPSRLMASLQMCRFLLETSHPSASVRRSRILI